MRVSVERKPTGSRFLLDRNGVPCDGFVCLFADVSLVDSQKLLVVKSFTESADIVEQQPITPAVVQADTPKQREPRHPLHASAWLAYANPRRTRPSGNWLTPIMLPKSFLRFAQKLLCSDMKNKRGASFFRNLRLIRLATTYSRTTAGSYYHRRLRA